MNRIGAGLMALLLGITVAAMCQNTSSSGELSGTSWQMVRFQDGDDKVLTPDAKEKYTIAFDREGGVSLRIDCNRGHGTWKSTEAHQLEFGPIALTRAMCPQAALTDRFTKDLSYVRSYVLRGGRLFLSLMADGGVYEFEPVPQKGEQAAVIKGTATYRERMALPPNAVFVATLEDVSRAEPPAEVLGSKTIEHPGNPPITFEIPYDRARIEASHRYSVRARILVDDKPLFTSDQNVPVLTDGHGEEVTVLLRRASAAGGHAAPASLENTYWKLTRLGDTPVEAVPNQREAQLVLNSQQERVTGSGGCNRITGSYALHDDELTLSQMISTMMACGTGMETETTFFKALGQVRKWKISGQKLELYDGDGKALAQLEAVYLK